MRRATVFALPSRYEGLGCVYLEAMSAGKPVIACLGQGIDEVIEQGVNGCLIRADDLQGLTDTLVRLLQQPEVRRKMGDAARRTILQGYTSGAASGAVIPALSGVPGMSRRLVILSEIIAPYRIPVFNALARHEGIDLHVIFLAESDPELRDWLVYKDEIRFSYQVLPSWRQRFAGYSLLLNRGVKAALQRAAPDVILCGGYNYLASWQAMRWARRNRVPFILWVESTDQDFRSRNRMIEFLKKKFMRRCSAFVVPGKSSFRVRQELWGAREKTFLPRPTQWTRNSLPGGRLPSVRMARDAARSCNCRSVSSCSWAGWFGKKECLTCLRPMAN